MDFFQVHPPLYYFYLLDLVLILFIVIYFILDGFLN
jgi:hypothetical protein